MWGIGPPYFEPSLLLHLCLLRAWTQRTVSSRNASVPFPFPLWIELSQRSLSPLGPGETASSQLAVENALPEPPASSLAESLGPLLPDSSSFSHWLPRQFCDLQSSPSASSRSLVSSGRLPALRRHSPLLCPPNTRILKGFFALMSCCIQTHY